MTTKQRSANGTNSMTSTDIVKILKACSEFNIGRMKYGELEVELAGHTSGMTIEREETGSYPLISAHEEIMDEELDRHPLPQDDDSMDILDPVGYEMNLLEGRTVGTDREAEQAL